MSDPSELSIAEIRKYMLENGCKVTNHALVKHFKRFLTKPETQEESRKQFKTYVNILATIKNENNQKYLVLRKKYIEECPSDELVKNALTADVVVVPNSPGGFSNASEAGISTSSSTSSVLATASPYRQPPPYKPPPEVYSPISHNKNAPAFPTVYEHEDTNKSLPRNQEPYQNFNDSTSLLNDTGSNVPLAPGENVTINMKAMDQQQNANKTKLKKQMSRSDSIDETKNSNNNNNNTNNKNKNNNNIHSLNSSIYSSNNCSLLSSSISNISWSSIKENSFNNSMNILNTSFNSSSNGSLMCDSSFANVSNNFSLPSNVSGISPNLSPPSSTFLIQSEHISPMQHIGCFYPQFQAPQFCSKQKEHRQSFSNHPATSDLFNGHHAILSNPVSSDNGLGCGFIMNYNYNNIYNNTNNNNFINNHINFNNINNTSVDILYNYYNEANVHYKNGFDSKTSAIYDNSNNTFKSNTSSNAKIQNIKPINAGDIVNNLKMTSGYEPLQPDTQPSKNVPFWMDPIWKSGKDTELADIRLPAMTPLADFALMLSPYSISKVVNLKKQFCFDVHDRKIA